MYGKPLAIPTSYLAVVFSLSVSYLFRTCLYVSGASKIYDQIEGDDSSSQLTLSQH